MISKKIDVTLWNRLCRYYKLTLPMKNSYSMNVGNPHDLYLATYYHGNDIAYLYLSQTGQAVYIINGEMICTRSRFDTTLCNDDILFKGYIAAGCFYIFDILTYRNHTVDMSLSDKLVLINNLIDFNYRPDPVLDLYAIKLADFVEQRYINSYIEQAPSWCKGLLYYPQYGLPILVTEIHYTSSALHQPMHLPLVKNIQTNIAVCFQIVKTNKPDVYHLYLQDDDKQLVFYDIASIPDKKTSHYMKHMMTSNSSYVNCVYDDSFKRWKPIAKTSTPPSTYKSLLSFSTT